MNYVNIFIDYSPAGYTSNACFQGCSGQQNWPPHKRFPVSVSLSPGCIISAVLNRLGLAASDGIDEAELVMLEQLYQSVFEEQFPEG